MNRSNIGTRILVRLGFAAVGLVIFLISRSTNLLQGDCGDTVVDNYIKAIDAITDKSDVVFDKMTANNEAETLAAYAKLADEASNIEHPSCLDGTHSEVMIVMQKRQEALKYAYNGDTEKADQLMKEADEHFDKANAAIP